MSSDLLSTQSLKNSSHITNPLFLEALRGQNRGKRPPIWIMRQAGRSLPSYRKLREKYPLDELFRTPELIYQITKLPLDDLGVDAAILFADILHVASLMGSNVHFKPQGGIEIAPLVQNSEDLKKVCPRNVLETLGFVQEGIQMLKKELTVPLIGFAGGPFTVATYLANKKVKEWLFSEPESFHQFLDMLTDSTIEYLQMQIEAGVNAIQIFESWANLLSRPQFQEFVIPYLKKIQAALPEGFPLMVFCRGSTMFIDHLVAINPTGISVDWSRPLWEIRQQVPPSIALQGNLDPELLYAPKEVIQRETKKLLRSMQGDPAFIVNLGHGVLPDTPVDHVKYFVETVTTWQQGA